MGFLLSPPQAESASDSRTMKATTPFAAVVIGLSTVLALLSLIFPPFQNVRISGDRKWSPGQSPNTKSVYCTVGSRLFP